MDSSQGDVKISKQKGQKIEDLNLGPAEGSRRHGSRFRRNPGPRSWTTGGGVKTPRRAGNGHS